MDVTKGEYMKMWLGYNLVKEFIQPDKTVKKFGNICWFTNLNTKKRNETLILYKTYNPTDYPTYDNYDAINVDKVKDIPMDYFGVMGVPITFMDKYNPEQFEIIDINPHFFNIVEQGLPKPKQLKIIGQKDPYARILIKRIQFEIVDCCEPCIDLNILKQNPKFKEYKSRQLIHEGKVCQKTYHRILIKRTEKEV